MNAKLAEVLIRIGDEFAHQILADSRVYLEVDIGKQAQRLGYSELEEQYHDICAIVPLKRPVSGMKVRVDGRTFVDYAQFESGIVVPGYVAAEVDLPRKSFVAQDSMVLNFA